MEFRLALSDGSVRLFERDGDAGVYSVRLLEEWTPAQLASLRTRNSELVEGMAAKVKDWYEYASALESLGGESGQHDVRDLAFSRGLLKCAGELKSLLPPDPATTNSKEKA